MEKVAWHIVYLVLHVMRKTLETSTERRLKSYPMRTSAVCETLQRFFSDSVQSDISQVTCLQCLWSQNLKRSCILVYWMKSKQFARNISQYDVPQHKDSYHNKILRQIARKIETTPYCNTRPPLHQCTHLNMVVLESNRGTVHREKKLDTNS